MDRTGLKIFLATAFGALVGTIVSLQLNQICWWLGMLTGGVVGYFVIQPSQVAAAMRLAWRVSGGVAREVQKRPGRALGSLVTILSWWLTLRYVPIQAIMMQLLTRLGFGGRSEEALELFTSFFLIWGAASCLFLCAMLQGFLNQPSVKRWWTLLLASPIFGFLFAIAFPLGLVLLGTIGPLAFLARRLYHAFQRARRVFPVFFRLVHSDLRLLCGLDAAIGAGIGYLSHSALIGAVIGGLFGLLNYEVVSKRILKLDQART